MNRSAIAENKKSLASTESTVKKQLATSTKKLSSLEKSLATVPSKKEIDSVSQRVTEQDLLLQSLRERVSNHNDTLKSVANQASASGTVAKKLPAIEKRVSSTEEAIKSFDAFRLTVNRDLLQLKQNKK